MFPYYQNFRQDAASCYEILFSRSSFILPHIRSEEGKTEFQENLEGLRRKFSRFVQPATIFLPNSLPSSPDIDIEAFISDTLKTFEKLIKTIKIISHRVSNLKQLLFELTEFYNYYNFLHTATLCFQTVSSLQKKSLDPLLAVPAPKKREKQLKEIILTLHKIYYSRKLSTREQLASIENFFQNQCSLEQYALVTSTLPQRFFSGNTIQRKLQALYHNFYQFTRNPTPNLLSLPGEILSHILSYLSWHDLYTMRRVLAPGLAAGFVLEQSISNTSSIKPRLEDMRHHFSPRFPLVAKKKILQGLSELDRSGHTLSLNSACKIAFCRYSNHSAVFYPDTGCVYIHNLETGQLVTQNQLIPNRHSPRKLSLFVHNNSMSIVLLLNREPDWDHSAPDQRAHMLLLWSLENGASTTQYLGPTLSDGSSEFCDCIFSPEGKYLIAWRKQSFSVFKKQENSYVSLFTSTTSPKTFPFSSPPGLPDFKNLTFPITDITFAGSDSSTIVMTGYIDLKWDPLYEPCWVRRVTLENQEEEELLNYSGQQPIYSQRNFERLRKNHKHNQLYLTTQYTISIYDLEKRSFIANYRRKSSISTGFYCQVEPAENFLVVVEIMQKKIEITLLDCTDYSPIKIFSIEHAWLALPDFNKEIQFLNNGKIVIFFSSNVRFYKLENQYMIVELPRII